VADARQKVVRFGALRIGQTLKKVVPIVNNSAAPLTFNVTLNPVTPALQEPGVVRLLPSEQPITLQAKGGMVKVEVMLAPKTRVSQFSEEVMYAYVSQCSLFFLHFVCCGWAFAQIWFIQCSQCTDIDMIFIAESAGLM